MSTEKQFYAGAQAFIEELMREAPTAATFLGDHRYDDRLSDNTPEFLADQRRRLGEELEKFEAFDRSDWSLDAKIDRRIIVQVIKGFIRSFDKTRGFERYPGNGPDECLGGVYSLIVREFAPLPERMKSILGRLRETPRVLAETRVLIKPHDVPRLWAEMSIESTRQGIGLFAGFVPMLANETPDLKDEVVAAAQAAATALEEHAKWIETEVLPHAQGDYAVGEDLFNELLSEDHMVDYDAVQLLKTGWHLYEDTERQMKELAASIDPGKTVMELLEDSKKIHPTANGLLDAYREWMAKARQFVIDNDIASIPAGESIRIIETPPFQRMFLPYAAYNMPGFFEKVQEGLFWVTPVEEGADPEAAEKKLRGHPWADIPVTALHEAYPGHHLQLVVANTLQSTPRKLGAFLSSLFIEGWAFYCEELMEQLGFINKPIQKLARLQAQLWRASRIIIDVSLHTGKMTVEEAVQFLVDRAGLEREDAKAEVNRYTLSPTQPQCYLMGKLQLLEIVAEYKRRFPKAGLRKMHDDILLSGSLPPRLMRLRLFGEA
ncbi:MAG: DUF885 domain-containing protein [Anaerolineales bacterium]|nr:DUF885 domain-containing protein [Anaerolineales bacterium]